LLPVGLNSLRFGVSWSPASSRFAVAVEGHVIHFFRRVGGFAARARERRERGEMREKKKKKKKKLRGDIFFFEVLQSDLTMVGTSSGSKLFAIDPTHRIAIQHTFP